MALKEIIINIGDYSRSRIILMLKYFIKPYLHIYRHQI